MECADGVPALSGELRNGSLRAGYDSYEALRLVCCIAPVPRRHPGRTPRLGATVATWRVAFGTSVPARVSTGSYIFPFFHLGATPRPHGTEVNRVARNYGSAMRPLQLHAQTSWRGALLGQEGRFKDQQHGSSLSSHQLLLCRCQLMVDHSHGLRATLPCCGALA
jgi:hypothetical protein